MPQHMTSLAPTRTLTHPFMHSGKIFEAPRLIVFDGVAFSVAGLQEIDLWITGMDRHTMRFLDMDFPWDDISVSSQTAWV